MSTTDPSDNCCVVCSKDLTSTPAAAHLYHNGRRFPLCCPMCIEMFQRAPARFASGEKPQTIVEELIARMRWNQPDRW